MQLWKSKPKLVLRNVVTSLTETDASSLLSFQLTEERLKLFYKTDPSKLSMHTVTIDLELWGPKWISRERENNIISDKYLQLRLSGAGERSNLELF